MWLDVSFSTYLTGLTTVGYRLYDATGGDAQARTTVGVVEVGNGGYGVDVDIPSSSTAVGVEWDTGQSAEVYAHESIQMQRRLEDLWALQGLDPANPLVVQTHRRDSGDVNQTIIGDPGTEVTVTRYL